MKLSLVYKVTSLLDNSCPCCFCFQMEVAVLEEGTTITTVVVTTHPALSHGSTESRGDTYLPNLRNTTLIHNLITSEDKIVMVFKMFH